MMLWLAAFHLLSQRSRESLKMLLTDFFQRSCKHTAGIRSRLFKWPERKLFLLNLAILWSCGCCCCCCWRRAVEGCSGLSVKGELACCESQTQSHNQLNLFVCLKSRLCGASRSVCSPRPGLLLSVREALAAKAAGGRNENISWREHPGGARRTCHADTVNCVLLCWESNALSAVGGVLCTWSSV